MYYTELDPYTLEPIYVAKSKEEKEMQRALLQYFITDNKSKVIKALIKARRTDLIGFDKKCLVSPDKDYQVMMRKKNTVTHKGGNQKWKKNTKMGRK